MSSSDPARNPTPLPPYEIHRKSAVTRYIHFRFGETGLLKQWLFSENPNAFFWERITNSKDRVYCPGSSPPHSPPRTLRLKNETMDGSSDAAKFEECEAKMITGA